VENTVAPLPTNFSTGTQTILKTDYRFAQLIGVPNLISAFVSKIYF